MKFKPVTSQVDFPTLEEETLKFWDDNHTFKKSVEQRKGHDRFVFYEGPPTANGRPGIHHVLVRSFKDIVCRYKTMKGFLVERKAGWDTHGLPVEIEVEKELGLRGKQDILELKDTQFESIKFFNEKCRQSVFRYVDEWVNITKRIAFWIDFDQAYITYQNNYIESVWWFLKQISEKGLLYSDYKVVPYCPRCGTSLSSHELAQGYKDDVEDPSVFIKFELEDEPGTYLLVWTTTPWTLPGNVALTIGKNIHYVKVEQDGEKYILAEKRLDVLDGKYKLLGDVKSEDILGKNYKPLFNYIKPEPKAFYVLEGDFATEEEGTGIVHTAVMYGVEDFELGKKANLPMQHTVSLKGEFVPEVEEFAGKFVKDADKDVTNNLKERGILYKSGTIKHTYPFCWRCGTPILYYALDSWFIKTTAVKKELLEDNQKINWVPKTIKTGRMKNWLETLIDWNVSRNRFWGTPLPVWVCPDKHIKVIGGKDEIEKLGGKAPEDLHKPFIDEVTLKCPDCGQEMRRVSDVVDVWMDSGAMPFAQWHYPFENKEIFKEWYPADYIVEAIDQTRGWFFTLMAEAMLLGNTSPAPVKNIFTTGHILDEKGLKMSKSKGNVVNPWDLIPATGADTIRWFFYTNCPAGSSVTFSKDLVSEKLRRFSLILWNSYKFFVDYANLTNREVEFGKESKRKEAVLDKWILSKLNQLIVLVGDKLDEYDFYASSRGIEDFVVNDLSTWYIRRSRDRVGPTADPDDEKAFLETTYEVLVTLSKLLAPFMPFISEEMYRNLTGETSVHLVDYPQGNKSLVDDQLIKDMGVVRKLVELGHSQRKEANIKLRQPLQKFIYFAPSKLDSDLEQIMAEELNVKEIEYTKSSDEQLNGKIDTNITPQLKEEGNARELIRQIQQLRKESGLTLRDKVNIISPNIPKQKSLVDLVLKQTNGVEITSGDKLEIQIVG